MGKVLIKSGVQPRLCLLLAAVANVAQELDWDVIITSAVDGCHKIRSRHYTHEAIDVRSKNFPSPQAKDDFIQAVLLRLGTGYEMFLENVGTENEHFHLEWDPR